MFFPDNTRELTFLLNGHVRKVYDDEILWSILYVEVQKDDESRVREREKSTSK